MCIENNVEMLYDLGENEINDGDELGVIDMHDANVGPAGNPGLAAGLAKRRHICETYFQF